MKNKVTLSAAVALSIIGSFCAMNTSASNLRVGKLDESKVTKEYLRDKFHKHHDINSNNKIRNEMNNNARYIKENNAMQNRQLANKISDNNTKIFKNISKGVNSLAQNLLGGVNSINNSVNDLRKDLDPINKKLDIMLDSTDHIRPSKLSHLCHDKNCNYATAHLCHDKACPVNRIKRTGATMNTNNLITLIASASLSTLAPILLIKNRRKKFSK